MKKCFSFFLIFLTALPLSVNAQVKPAQVEQAIPQSKPISSRDVFPPLPPSSFCTKEELIGIWKLIMIYEVPSGREIELYTQRPLQYFVFEPDSRYGEYTSILNAVTLREVRDSVIENQRQIQQYSLNKSGMVFFYKDSTPVDSLACFLVAKTTPPFAKGQLLMMPSEKSARGRMVKVYQKMYIELETPPAVVFETGGDEGLGDIMGEVPPDTKTEGKEKGQ
jgi:hypothetical protein